VRTRDVPLWRAAAHRAPRRRRGSKGRLAASEVFRLVGRLHGLPRTARALRWWRAALDEGRRLGARPEVARTQLELRRRSPCAPLGASPGSTRASTALRRATFAGSARRPRGARRRRATTASGPGCAAGAAQRA
jgi:hypothetical protein